MREKGKLCASLQRHRLCLYSLSLSNELRYGRSAMNDFRSYLQTELVRRCKANPKYSLRAFARAFGSLVVSTLKNFEGDETKPTEELVPPLPQPAASPPLELQPDESRVASIRAKSTLLRLSLFLICIRLRLVMTRRNALLH
jgi:hypothetical protein